MMLKRLKNSRRGSSLVEYGILAGLIGAGAVGLIVMTGDEVKSSLFSSAEEVGKVKDKVKDGSSGGTGGSGGGGTPPPSEPEPMILTFNADKGTATLPLNGAVDATIDWGGPASTCPTYVNSVGNVTCTYDTPGVYTVSISGLVDHYGPADWSAVPDIQSLIRVDQWGDVGTTNLFRAFSDAHNLVSLPNDFPSGVTDVSHMFQNITGNPTLGSSWDMSSVTNAASMFHNATNFNQDISGWKTGNVTRMNSMFLNAKKFNSPLANWDLSSVNEAGYMFSGALAFNQDLTNWNVSAMWWSDGMFQGATSFNGDVSNWDVSGWTTFKELFKNTAFNRDLSLWNVGNGQYFDSMFHDGALFNQDISMWNMANALSAEKMFKDAPKFNQDLTGWCVTKMTSEPLEFALRSPLDTSGLKPVWGTCPTP